MSPHLRLSLTLLCLLLPGPASAAKDLTVAVASNFQAPMRQIAEQFERDTGHALVLVFGSSGKFHAQIRQGAPFDVFLSADQVKPAQLESDDLAGSRMTYAIGRLALWSAQPGRRIDGPDVLRNPQLGKLALANPRVAPYGAAAMQTLQHLGLDALSRSHAVMGENISQTFQFVASGNAELGFVALSQLIGRAEPGSWWLVPEQLHQPIAQDAVLLTQARHPQAGRALLAFLASESAGEIIRAHGYTLPTLVPQP